MQLITSLGGGERWCQAFGMSMWQHSSCRAPWPLGAELAKTMSLFACACRRWGDSPLRYLQCMMFLDYRNETQKLDFIDYVHDKVSLL